VPDVGLSFEEIIRGVQAFVLVWVLMSMGEFIIKYYKTIYPLRQQIGDQLLAPPPELTLRYHRDVFALACVSFVATGYAISQGFPLNPFTFGTIIIWADIAWTIHKWTPTYENILREARDGGNGDSRVASHKRPKEDRS